MRPFLFSVLLLLGACREKPAPKAPRLTKEQEKYVDEQINTWTVKRETDEINQYIKIHDWKMETTGSGLRYMLLKSGKGPLATVGQKVKVDYRIYLLDGTLLYSSEKDGAKEVLIGKDNVESGLHEGLQLMHVGDQMRFVLPSHLAHGLSGDQSKIPPLASVMYEIELLEIVNTK